MSIKDTFLISDPNVSYKVVKILELGKSYPGEIAEKTDLDPRAVTYCLRVLERNDLVTQKLEETPNPFKARVRNFSLTQKAIDALGKLEND